MRSLILCLATVILVAGFPIPGNAVDESLVLLFTFEEGEGDTTKDKSGHGNTGILVKGAKWGEGKYGNGLILGNGSYVNVSDNEGLDEVSELTIELWANINQVNNATFAAKDTWDSSFHSHLWTGDMIYWGYSVADRMNTPGGTIIAGEWAHFALQYDGPGSMWRIYKDGEEVAAGPAVIQEIPDTDVNFSIGGRDLGGDSVDGIIDEVAVYSKVLSEEEIRRDMKGISVAVEPVGRLAATWALIKRGDGY